MKRTIEIVGLFGGVFAGIVGVNYFLDNYYQNNYIPVKEGESNFYN
jgi:hypothetical protein